MLATPRSPTHVPAHRQQATIAADREAAPFSSSPEHSLSWSWWIELKQDIDSNTDNSHNDQSSASSFRLLHLSLERCSDKKKVSHPFAIDTGGDDDHELYMGQTASDVFRIEARPALARFLRSLVAAVDKHGSALAVVVISDVEGFVADAGFLMKRLSGLKAVREIVSFVNFNDAISPGTTAAVNSSSEEKVEDLLVQAVGAVLMDTNVATTDVLHVESEIRDRLDYSWTSPAPLRRKQVAFVTDHLTVDATRHKWNCARDLGLDVVVFSSGKWWLDEKVAAIWSVLVAGFVDVDVTPDEGLIKRLTTAVSAYSNHLDGICAGGDRYLAAVSRVAEAMGLPTESSEAYAVSTDKQRTRKLEPDATECFETRTVEEVLQRLQGDDGAITFPVISKPAQGSLSSCVFKSDNQADLLHNIAKTIAVRQSDERIIIEPYVFGPEVDVNIVLLDGELLFSEVVDEPPSAADLDSTSPLASFAESQAITPSILPSDEQANLVRSITRSVLRQGFRNGVFHCEARVRNSRSEYGPLAGTTGMLELQDAKQSSIDATSTFLLEVNARCPGLMSASATLLTSGVDFWSLQLLACVGEWTRFKHFAKRFTDTSCHVMLDTYPVEVSSDLVQYMFPGADITKINKPYIDDDSNPMKEVQAWCPALVQHVVRHAAMVKPAGMYGGDLDKWLWLQTVVLSADCSRAELLKASERLRLQYEDVVRRRDQECRKTLVR